MTPTHAIGAGLAVVAVSFYGFWFVTVTRYHPPPGPAQPWIGCHHLVIDEAPTPPACLSILNPPRKDTP